MDRLASMETFIRVVETGSFSGAARQLRVGQPAVSKTVAQLETYLSVKLLTRSTRGLTPTEAGLGYFERAKRQIDLVQEGIDLGLRMGKMLDSALTVRRVGRCKRLVLGTPDYFQRAGTPATPAELSKHQAVVYLQGEGGIWSFRRDSSEAAVKVQSRLKVTAAEGVRAAVLAHVGLTI